MDYDNINNEDEEEAGLMMLLLVVNANLIKTMEMFLLTTFLQYWPRV